jgi:tape measure domain-containing protein
MPEIAKMWATIGADTSDFDKGLASTKEKLSAFGQGFQQLQSMATVALAAVGTAIVGSATAVATTGIQFDALKESANTAFTTMIGSGTGAKIMLDQLQAFAQKTPFEFPDLIRASQRLMAMGFQASQVIPQLTAIGDAVAAMGGSAEMVDRVTLAIGQMNAKGKASGEEMRQLTEAGIPVWQMLADKIGVTVPEAMQKVSDGAVGAGVAIDAINEGIESRFGGMMDKQSQTWNGIISNIKDGFTQLSGTIMQPFFDAAKEKLAGVATALGILQKAFANGQVSVDTFREAMSAIMPKETVDNLIAFWQSLQNGIEIVRTVIKPITDLIAKFVTWQDVFTALGIVIVATLASIVVSFAPVIATFAVLTAGVAALRWAWENDFGNIRTFTLGVFNRITDFMHQHFGNWVDSWQALSDHLNFIIFYMWSNYVYFPIRSFLIKTRDDLVLYLRIMENAWDRWVNTIKEIISGWVNDTVRIYTIWKDRILSWYHEWADPLYRNIENWTIGIHNFFNHMVAVTMIAIHDWKVWMIGIFDELKGWWDKNVQPWIDKGRELVQGLWDGVRDVWNRFTAWFRSEWQYLKDGWDRLWRSGSPSKEMEDRGKWLMEGLANGVNAGKGAVYDAFDGLHTDVNHNTNASATYGYAASSSSASPDVALMQRNNDLLAALLQELRDKNMSVTVAGGGGISLGVLTDHYTGMRAAT